MRFNSKFDIYTNIEAASISTSRPISILEMSHYDLETDLDTYFVKILRQYRYDVDISAFLAIPTSISISNQSVSHITELELLINSTRNSWEILLSIAKGPKMS